MSRKGADLIGQRFERLTVIAAAASRRRPDGQLQRYWLCQCDCGNEVAVTTANLQYGNTKSCGCARKGNAPNRKDLTGHVYGSITVIDKAPSRKSARTTTGYWRCRCSCGTELEIPTGNLLSGNTTTCGCGRSDPVRRAAISLALTTHGHSNYNSATYRSWTAMRKRCRERHRYADRGITVDPRWDKFENFLADMGERPEGTTLDRIDNDGPYSPENCRWATGLTQGNNRGNNSYITYNGRTQTYAEWAREIGVSRGALYNRIVLYKWPLDRAMSGRP